MARGLISPLVGASRCTCACAETRPIAQVRVQQAKVQRLTLQSKTVRKLRFMKYFTLITKYAQRGAVVQTNLRYSDL